MSDRLAVMNHGRIVQLGTPEEVYNEPTDAYVADFLGVSNLMDAHVEPGGNGEGPVPPAAGRVQARRHGRRARRDRRGQGGDPSRAHAVDAYETSGANRVPGMVERLVFLGSTTQIFVRLASGAASRRSCATTGTTLPFSQGTPVSVALPADALRVLPDPGVSVAEIHDETIGDQRARPDQHAARADRGARARLRARRACLDSPR